MSPTVLRVSATTGEAKFWLEPKIALARNHRLTRIQLTEVEAIIEAHCDEFTKAWGRHFKS